MTLSELYEELAAVPALSGSVERRRAPHCPLDLFAFAEKPSNLLGFRILLPALAIATGQKLPSLHGLHLTRQNRNDGVNLILTATSPAFHDVFISLVSDLIAQADRETEPEVAAAALLGRLNKWQIFLKNLPPEGLGPKEQQGLYGELWLLRHQALAHGTRSEAVRAWTGPFKTGKDFQFVGGSVEVKTSIAGGDQRLQINGERQLDDMGLPCLLLAHLSLEPVQESGETLPDMVQATRSIITGDFMALQAFEDRLRESGYLDVHESRYRTPGYIVREFNLFHIRDAFPRLVETMLPSGVGNVNYMITVSACEPFRASETQLWALWEGNV